MEVMSPVPLSPASASPDGSRDDSGSILVLVNGVLAGVSGTYISTNSLLITVVAALTAVALTVTVLLIRSSR